MSDPSSTTNTDPPAATTEENGETHTATVTTTTAAAAASPPPPPVAPQPFVRPPPSETFDPATAFMEAYDCAKLNHNWHKVSSSLMIHPEWLTRIPEGRRWTMLHQIVFSGNIMHLHEVLALQASNPQFRLLCKTLDNKTVREIAADRAHIHPQMMRRIERLVAIDQLLNNAKDRKWELVKQCISLQPDIVNEKPPYRRFYLAHHLACVGELEIFKDLSTICHFKLDLLADNKTISQVARENNRVDFAEHVESLMTVSNETTAADHTDQPVATHAAASTTHYSPGFYDDPGISFMPANINLSTLFLSSSDTLSYPGNHHSAHSNHHASIDNSYTTHSLHQGQHSTTLPTTTTHENSTQEHAATTDKKSVKPKADVPQMTDDEQAKYEQTIMSNVQKMSHDNLLNSITCCITKTILHDPVVAADGFTYEREAILNWFEQSNRSPMTNQELENLELKPNYAIKSILQLLQGTSASQEKSTEK